MKGFDKANDFLRDHDGMFKHLGIKFISTPEEDRCVATMPVDERNLQPFGRLCGGATLTLAEMLAGVASTFVCPDMACAGLSVSGNHIHGAKEGDLVTATAKLLHKGKHTHVWQVEVRNQDDKLISNVSVTNFVAPKC